MSQSDDLQVRRPNSDDRDIKNTLVHPELSKEDLGASSTGQRKYFSMYLKPILTSRYVPVVFFLLVITAISLIVPSFFTQRNLINILVQSSALGLMTIGITAVLISGGIDISLPGLMALGGIAGVMYMREGGDPLLAGVIMIAIAVIGGAINGFAIGYLKMIPMVVTLATMAIATGASISITDARSVLGIHPVFSEVVLMKVLGIPMPIIILLVFTVLAAYLMRNSIYGRWLYAVGTNKKASRVSGVPTRGVIFGTYVFAGFFAGLAAIITTARLGAAAASMGKEGVVLDIMSSAVVGGVSMYGGVGSALGAVIGAIIITLISNSMNMLHVSYYITLVIKGLVIIGVVALDSLRRR